jgi:hypothetical protein
VIGTFRIPNYDVEGPILNTRLSPLAALEYGSTFGTAENQIGAGLRRVYITNLNILHTMVILLKQHSGKLGTPHTNLKI